MNKIKALIFDAGGVVIDAEGQIEELARIFKPNDKGAFWAKINHYIGPLCKGGMPKPITGKSLLGLKTWTPEKSRQTCGS